MYTKPELMIEQFEVEDIITASSEDPGNQNTLDNFELPNMSVDSFVF